MQRCALFAGGLLVTHLGSAWANLRAPIEATVVPSTSMRTRAAGLVVRAETLRFECENAERDFYKDPAQTRCQVSASYVIQARTVTPRAVALEFVHPSLPQSPQVTVVVNQDSAVAVPTESVPADERSGYRPSGDAPGERHTETLLRSRFDAALRPVDNRVTVRYEQPLSYKESGYSYFHKGSFTQSLQYELWPLKEWQQAPDFALHITVALPRRPPSRWSRYFRTHLALRCGGVRYPAEDPQHTGQQGDRLIYDVTLGGEFPDHFFCQIGPAKRLFSQ